MNARTMFILGMTGALSAVDPSTAWMPSGRIPFVAQAGDSLPHAALAQPQREVRFTVEQMQDDQWIRTINGGGPGVIYLLPAGTFDATTIIRLGASEVTLRGAGREATTIRFPQPLRWHYRGWEQTGDPLEIWSWRGGLVWIQANPVGLSDQYPRGRAVIGDADEGALSITVQTDPDQRQVGLSYLHYLGDQSFRDIAYGHAASAGQVPWSDWNKVDKSGVTRWEYPVHISHWEGNRAFLTTPLRLPIKSAWQVMLAPRSGEVTGVEVSDLTVAFPEHPAKEHLKEDGYNALFASVATSVRIRNVRILNADNAVTLERTSHSLVEDVVMETTNAMHHGVSLRDMSHNNLITKFIISSKVRHGLSVQDLSSGNVFSVGVADFGTFDSHRGMPFDNVRTDITLRGTGRLGGAKGPLVGRRMVNWNIRIDLSEEARKGKKTRSLMAPVTGSKWYVMGALVGIQGYEIIEDIEGWSLPPGDKDTLVLDVGQVPATANLHLAQQAWWRESKK